jgi:hypothetical protein
MAPSPSRIAAPTAQMRPVCSSRSNATPLARTRASSASSSARAVIVRGVRRGKRRGSTASIAGSDSVASSASPFAVQ